MVEKLLPVRPVQNTAKKHPEFIPTRKKDEPGKRSSDDDRVDVAHDSAVDTYGKLAGVEVGSPYQLLLQLVVKTLTDQGVPSQISSGEGTIDLGTLAPEAAQELVSDDGYFGVEKTSQRIVDFAINAFGNDIEKLTQMKDAIEKGFKDAADVFGGQLPEISHETYAAVMEKLDAFAAEQGEGRGDTHG